MNHTVFKELCKLLNPKKFGKKLIIPIRAGYTERGTIKIPQIKSATERDR